MICKGCGKTFETRASKKLFCTPSCRKMWHNHQRFPNESEHVECKICGFRGREIFNHILKVHKISLNEYYQTFACDLESIMVDSIRATISSHSFENAKNGKVGFQKGSFNPSHSLECKAGRRSPFSLNYYKYDGMSEKEKTELIQKLCDEVKETKRKNHSITTTLDYYLNKGMTQEEAKKARRQRQQTFSLKKCIEKYGEEEGQRKWKQRQDKWLNTLSKKSPEEIDRINKLKAQSCHFLRSYSKKSQKLFWEVEKRIRSQFKEIYFATYVNGIIANDGINHEYEVRFPDGLHKYLLDFYVKDINKVIEFDGTWWHGRSESQRQRDLIRENALKKMGFVNILHISESEYDKEPELVIRRCVQFLTEGC